MRPKRFLARAFVVLATVGLAMPVFAQQTNWTGQTVLVKKSGIKISYTDDDGRRVTAAELTGVDYKVIDDQGGWIKVRHAGAEGWFGKEDAVLLSEAAEYFSAKIRENPQEGAYYNYRGVAWKLRGELDIAIKDYSEAIRLHSTEAAYFNNRGLAYWDKRQLEKALDDLDEAVRLKPGAVYFRNRADLLLDMKRPQRALEDAEEAVRLDSRYSSAYLSRGMAHYDLKDFDKAKEDFDEALRLDPKFCRRLPAARGAAGRYGQD